MDLPHQEARLGHDCLTTAKGWGAVGEDSAGPVVIGVVLLYPPLLMVMFPLIVSIRIRCFPPPDTPVP